MIPVPETPLDDVAFVDKWTHFVMYGSLTIVLWAEHFFALYRNGQPLSLRCKRLYVGGVVLPIIMGGMVELAQAYLTTCRSGDWFDALCNSLGVLLGAALSACAVCVFRRVVGKR